MINNNKILTVSYGTFSCTLEGFDDSFGTMKAIAEYFRDLASDDRYFGAEPPQPDAQMLARIAQREISRHVEARQDEGRIVLSAKTTPQAAAQVAAGAVEDVATAVADATQTTAELTSEDITPAEAPQPVAKPAPVAKDVPAVKSQPAPEAAAVHTPAATDDTPQDIVPSLPDEEVEAFFAEQPASETKSNVSAEQNVTAAAPMSALEAARDNSIADKLKRIRAVVSQQSEEDTTPDYSEDQHADATVETVKTEEIVAKEPVVEKRTFKISPKLNKPVTPKPQAPTTPPPAVAEADENAQTTAQANAVRDIEEALNADDDFDAANAQSSENYDDENDDITAILNRLDQEADAPAQDTSPLEEESSSSDADDQMEGNILASMEGADAVDEADDDNLFDGDETDAIEEEAAEVSETVAAAEPAPVVSTPRPAPRTRVLKVKRASLDAAIRSGALEEYDDEEEETAAAQQPTPEPRKAPLADKSTLSAEAEAELARELAEIEAEISPKEEVTSSDADNTAQEVKPKTGIHSTADDDLSRLMKETDSQMDEPESNTRRDAFAHLRAAVAAKKADEAVGGMPEEQDTGEAYRDDLATVVRPRRPTGRSGTRTERPMENRAAPLKLVAEQRIDGGSTNSGAQVRPRRVATLAPQPAVQEAATDARSFADFANDMGAETLSDLLEAAAAYLSYIEGHEEFSRPQLMTKVRQVEQEDFTREDSLRSFGKLLREGKIEKLRGGRFQVSDQIGFKPDARAAG
ncbi:hypothetical protein GGR95_000609 [Sulfitobacter undariae]|uniref:Lipoprotein n=1 Tax=Sulfitobacter undariae TaxID=1563671 RepID=A0A7W6GZ12_9RHOB|nr:hypothetical protein [Sulfitobacter undariae]MBB3992990.1 hypothetical protein [Sulfitobacter undariae]